ncbi:MAG: hypothetical protein R6V17_07015, partial [Halanaerobacter sp.]
DFKQVFSLFYSPRQLKRIFFKTLNPLLSFDLNTLIYPTQPNYELLSGQEYNYVEQLLLKSVGEAHMMIKEVIKFLNNDNQLQIEDIFPKINFDGEKI